MNIVYFQTLFVISWNLITVYSTSSDCITDSPQEKKLIEVLNPLLGKKITVKDGPGDYSYDISFCKKLEKDAGVLQTPLGEDNPHKAAVGRVNNTDIKIGTNWLFLTYKDGDHYGSHCGKEPRQAHIFILCGDNVDPDHVSVIEENNNKSKDCYYLFEMKSSVACNTSSSSSMSFGWILVIIILSLSAVYLILGFLYQRFVMQAKGREQIPNLSFWMKVGSLAADGCDFVCRCNNPEEVRSYKGLGDDQLGLDEDEERDENILPMY